MSKYRSNRFSWLQSPFLVQRDIEIERGREGGGVGRMGGGEEMIESDNCVCLEIPRNLKLFRRYQYQTPGCLLQFQFYASKMMHQK